MVTVRVDSWIWAVRLTKTRSAATAACKAGHVRVNGERAKPAQPVSVGDEVRVRIGDERIVVARALLVKRVSAVVAAESYSDLTPPRPPRAETPTDVTRDRGSGRPTKRDRRDLERLRGR
ncbi:RNA-binding S4 domain-containing protein [Labedella phragmitis]|uniref:RNA-binding S4 domain-containing protein n=1 Tax=Labedella phragmitis TaxID=2498849 RepID=A0A444PVB2_9MICO|nr:S4 domain-containing protein [Labedella phragmitis]RWZ51807.1 RNA-binding S4 domain-containing protein [Labedella phragmitis]